ncbi:MAG: DUF3313 domain-containing protein, partial [Lentisphaerae bacterium]|nr:DUF3313 domain-containing protein [Lentisphaerota bacterium]
YGCKASPVADSGFIKNPEMMKKYDVLPVQKAWKDPNFKASSYNEIMVYPVYTKDQLDKTWMEDANIRTWMDEENSDVKEFAQYTEKAFKKAVTQSKNYTLVDKPGPKTLILELALVKIVPGKPVLGAAKNLAAPIVGGFRLMALAMAPARTAISASSDSPLQASVAIEGRILDGVSKKVVATFADREKQESAIVNFNDFSAYGNLEQIVDQWACQFVEILDNHPLETGIKIEDKEPSIRLLNY